MWRVGTHIHTDPCLSFSGHTPPPTPRFLNRCIAVLLTPVRKLLFKTINKTTGLGSFGVLLWGLDYELSLIWHELVVFVRFWGLVPIIQDYILPFVLMVITNTA